MRRGRSCRAQSGHTLTPLCVHSPTPYTTLQPYPVQGQAYGTTASMSVRTYACTFSCMSKNIHIYASIDIDIDTYVLYITLLITNLLSPLPLQVGFGVARYPPKLRNQRWLAIKQSETKLSRFINKSAIPFLTAN